MRKVVVILAVVGAVFIALLLLSPGRPATGSQPGYRPKAPAWLTRLLPNPPASLPYAGTVPPSALESGAGWSGRFTAKNGELGFVRLRLVEGPALKVSVQEAGEDDQLLCIAAPGVARPGGCGNDNMADGQKGGVLVHKGTANVRIEAPAGRVAFTVNE